MAASPKAGASDCSWTSPKRVGKPKSFVSTSFSVSRNSGLQADVGTFGGAERFSERVKGYGASSPNGRNYLARNQLYKTEIEKGLECTQGIGSRPEAASRKMPVNVGPGSYDIVASAAKRRSPLDGPVYCNMQIHAKLPSKLVPADLCSPGPHHRYEVRRDLDRELPNYGMPMLSRQARHPYPEDRDGPGPGDYPIQNYKSVAGSVAGSMSAPDLRSARQRTVKCMFGTADRFKVQSIPNSSPNGSYYYSHYKPKDQEDYLAGARTCTFGKGNKTDFASDKYQTSPVSYSPVTSMAFKTSALDGLTTRLQSPICAFTKAAAASKVASRSAGVANSCAQAAGAVARTEVCGTELGAAAAAIA